MHGLANRGGVVAGLAQGLGQRWGRRVDLVEAECAAAVRVAPGHDRSAARLADRDGDVGMLEANALAGQFVQMGRDAFELIAKAAEASPNSCRSA